jgi:hypothetical protein
MKDPACPRPAPGLSFDPESEQVGIDPFVAQGGPRGACAKLALGEHSVRREKLDTSVESGQENDLERSE